MTFYYRPTSVRRAHSSLRRPPHFILATLREAARHVPHALCADGAACRLGVAIDAPAGLFCLGAATREGLARKCRFDTRLMQLIAE